MCLLGWDVVVGTATCYRLGGGFSTPIQAGTGAHPASYTMGTRSFLGVKRPERGTEHRTSSSADVKERAQV
jgi:hypothetical protein